MHPEAGLLQRAQNLHVYVLRRSGVLKLYNDYPMGAPERGYPQEAGERRVTT